MARHAQRHVYSGPGDLDPRATLHQRFSTNPRPWHRWVLDQVEPGDDDVILEVGAGPGDLWAQTRTRTVAARIVASDISPGMVSAGRRRTEAIDITWLVAAAGALPFRDMTFNKVVANHMLYHVPDISTTLQELRRVLTPGGHLFAATNGSRHMEELDQLDTDWPRTTMSFTLENGARYLGQSFVQVGCRIRNDALEVSDPDAAADYLTSYRDVDRLAVKEKIRRHIDEHGTFSITKATGLFTAERGE